MEETALVGTLDMTTPYAPTADAMESRLGDETVILHMGSGTYFGLDAVGTLGWERLGDDDGATVDQVCAHVRAGFTDSPSSVEADVTAFLAQLMQHGLIQPSSRGG